MITKKLEPLTFREAERLARRGQWTIAGLFGRGKSKPINHPENQQAVIYSVTVEKCFVVIMPRDEFTIYFLDVGGSILVLFGEWLFDPHTTVVSEGVFSKWECQKEFYSRFSLRGFAETRTVFELVVEGEDFIPAQVLKQDVRFKRLREFELIPGSGETLMQSLRAAGIAE